MRKLTQYSHLPNSSGHRATPIPGGEPGSTYCGDIDLDGMTYRVHRGPRRRTLVEIIDAQDRPAWRFELEETVWVEPVQPEPLETAECLWCDLGAPDTFRLAGESDEDGVYLIGLAEHPDGGGRVLSLSIDPDEDDIDAGFDTYYLVLDPGAARVYGDVRSATVSTTAFDPWLAVRALVSFHRTEDDDRT